MYSLLVAGAGWSGQRDRLDATRLFEHTEQFIKDRFRPEGQTDFSGLALLPALFMQESHSRPAEQVVRLGSIRAVRTVGRDLVIEYLYDPPISGLTNAVVQELADALQIDNWEFSRTHWAVKDVDLCRVLLRHVQPRPRRPRVFSLADPETTEETLLAAMMPFQASFDPVYEAVKRAADAVQMRCRRADEIWENPAIIQDIVSLLDRARVVVCDCTGRNPNVFYEIGIAHTIGREVLLITQSEADVPFDLRHLRFVAYLNNREGLAALQARLESRLADLVAGGASR